MTVLQISTAALCDKFGHRTDRGLVWQITAFFDNDGCATLVIFGSKYADFGALGSLICGVRHKIVILLQSRIQFLLDNA